MKKTLLLTFGMSSMLLATTPNVYVDIHQVMLTHSDNGTSSDFKPTGFKWTLGYLLQEFVGIETSAMLGVNNDTKTLVNTSTLGTFSNAQTSLNKLYNLNLKAIIPIVNNLNFNMYLGGSRSKMLSTAVDYRSNDHWDNSVSYGAGLSYELGSSKVSVEMDYMQYFKNLNAIEFGFGFKF